MKKHEAYTQLKRFIGQWKTSGRILSTSFSPEINISGTDTYEWIPGNFFVLHKVDVMIGSERNQTFEIIGYDQKRTLYIMQYYNNKGVSGSMTGNIVDDIWTFQGEKLRFRGGFSDADRVFSGIWEQLNEKTWVHFMDIRLIKT